MSGPMAIEAKGLGVRLRASTGPARARPVALRGHDDGPARGERRRQDDAPAPPVRPAEAGGGERLGPRDRPHARARPAQRPSRLRARRARRVALDDGRGAGAFPLGPPPAVGRGAREGAPRVHAGAREPSPAGHEPRRGHEGDDRDDARARARGAAARRALRRSRPDRPRGDPRVRRPVARGGHAHGARLDARPRRGGAARRPGGRARRTGASVASSRWTRRRRGPRPAARRSRGCSRTSYGGNAHEPAARVDVEGGPGAPVGAPRGVAGRGPDHGAAVRRVPEETTRDTLDHLPGVAVALATLVLGLDLFARETRRSTHALILRTPGAMRWAFPAKLLLFAARDARSAGDRGGPAAPARGGRPAFPRPYRYAFFEGEWRRFDRPIQPETEFGMPDDDLPRVSWPPPSGSGTSRARWCLPAPAWARSAACWRWASSPCRCCCCTRSTPGGSVRPPPRRTRGSRASACAGLLVAGVAWYSGRRFLFPRKAAALRGGVVAVVLAGPRDGRHGVRDRPMGGRGPPRPRVPHRVRLPGSRGEEALPDDQPREHVRASFSTDGSPEPCRTRGRWRSTIRRGASPRCGWARGSGCRRESPRMRGARPRALRRARRPGPSPREITWTDRWTWIDTTTTRRPARAAARTRSRPRRSRRRERRPRRRRRCATRRGAACGGSRASWSGTETRTASPVPSLSRPDASQQRRDLPPSGFVVEGSFAGSRSLAT